MENLFSVLVRYYGKLQPETYDLDQAPPRNPNFPSGSRSNHTDHGAPLASRKATHLRSEPAEALRMAAAVVAERRRDLTLARRFGVSRGVPKHELDHRDFGRV